MLTLVKLALRITTNSFDTELNMLINDCLAEMSGLGVLGAVSTSTDAQIQSTVVAYCKWKFGDAENKDAFERIYHTKLAQLKTMTGYTDWGIDG